MRRKDIRFINVMKLKHKLEGGWRQYPDESYLNCKIELASIKAGDPDITGRGQGIQDPPLYYRFPTERKSGSVNNLFHCFIHNNAFEQAIPK